MRRFTKSRSRCAIRYTMPDEGELVTYYERRLDSLGLDRFSDRVEFWQGDACNMKPSLTGFELILAANLIDRLYSPRLFLNQVAERLNPGGLLVVASPYTWLEDYTKRKFQHTLSEATVWKKCTE